MKPYPLEIREQILAAVDAGLRNREIVARFGVSVATIRYYLKLRREGHSLAPRPHSWGRRPSMLGPRELAELDRLRKLHPRASSRELAVLLSEATSLDVSCNVVLYGLSKLGVTRRRLRGSSRPVLPARKPKPYGPISAQEPLLASTRRMYPTDLSDSEWALLEPLIPKTRPGGRPESHTRRELVNAMLYVLRNGCTWRSLPHDLPAWSTVYSYFRKWRLSGLWEQINDALRPQVRSAAGRGTSPRAAIVDSQSARTTEKGGPADTMAGSA